MMTHDHNFKNLTLDYGIPMIEFLAECETGILSPDVIVTPMPQEQMKERLGDRFKELDVALLLEFPDDSRKSIVFCIEFNSRAEEHFWRRHAIYCLQLSEFYQTLRVVPVVVYPFESEPPPGACSLAADAGIRLDFRGITVTLGSLDAGNYLNSGNLAARLCLPLMKYKEEDKLAVIIKACEGLAELEKRHDKRVKYFEFIAFYAKMNTEQVAEFYDKYVELSPQKEFIMTMRSVLLEMREKKGEAAGFLKGEAKGFMKGEATGEAKGSVNTILSLFEDGALTRRQARTRLEAIPVSNAAARAIVDAALKRISAKGGR